MPMITIVLLVNSRQDKTDRQTNRQTDRHKSFIDMRYYTEQYSKSNSIEENRVKSNQIDLK